MFKPYTGLTQQVIASSLDNHPSLFTEPEGSIIHTEIQ